MMPGTSESTTMTLSQELGAGDHQWHTSPRLRVTCLRRHVQLEAVNEREENCGGTLARASFPPTAAGFSGGLQLPPTVFLAWKYRIYFDFIVDSQMKTAGGNCGG